MIFRLFLTTLIPKMQAMIMFLESFLHTLKNAQKQLLSEFPMYYLKQISLIDKDNSMVITKGKWVETGRRWYRGYKWWWKETWLGVVNNTIYRQCIMELYTWNLYNFINQCLHSKFNKKERKRPHFRKGMHTGKRCTEITFVNWVSPSD